ncbi:hypothetical protein [Rhodopirellula halodulae]|uniref:hypothetical protein n=1 Tax=Rhodopirellula halodulae TaxID=2894198 RepID=UPI001E5C2605|nr:hypothetical protein [Rhodopirellula sp. JC737]MCC9654797.1 hypothetical protein [Rhodopirellula sp. JC737]
MSHPTLKHCAWTFSCMLLITFATGCDDSDGTIVVPDTEQTSSEVPTSEMSEEEYAKELQKSMQ